MPFPPPRIENDGLIIADTDYADGPWAKAEMPWLDNHRGILRVLVPASWFHLIHRRVRPPLILTRGNFPCGCEALEFLFPAMPHHFHLPAAHASRLPGDPAGKRPWEVEFWNPSPILEPRMLRCLTAVWRAAPLPCLLPWDGPLPKPGDFPPRSEPRATHNSWRREHPIYKMGVPRK